LVNSFERHYKWPLSKIQFVDDRRYDACVPSALFIGCRKWVTSPYLVSVYMLLLRTGIRPWLGNGVINKTDHNELITGLKNTAEECRNIQPDAMHIYRSLKMIDILMANYKELFSDKPKKYHWATARVRKGASSYNEGIRKLAEGQTGNTELHDKCKALIKKVK
jgi:hypothetical protein